MPRSKIFLTDEDKIALQKQGERLKGLMKQNKITVEKLMDITGYSKTMIGYYRAGSHPLPPNLAELLEPLLGACTPYLTGYSDCRTWAEYHQWELSIEDEALAEYERGERLKIAQHKAFFAVCGYEYQCLINSAEYDFSGIFNPSEAVQGPHHLISQRHPEQSIYLSQPEFEALVGELQNTVGYFLYKKERSAHERG